MMLVRSYLLQSITIGGGECLLIDEFRKRTVLVSEVSARLLAHCSVFRTLDGHAEYIVAQLKSPFGEIGKIRKVLGDLHAKELLVSKEEIVGRIQKIAHAEKDTSIDVIGVITADRPYELERCLSSIKENICRYDHRVQVIVADDSENEESLLSYSRYAIDTCWSISYCGYSQKRSFCRYLEELGVPANVSRFAIFGGQKPTMGANRNSLLLATIGKKIVSCDDDIVFRTARRKPTRPDVVFGAHEDPVESKFYVSREQIINSDVWIETDIIGEIGQFLGKSLGACHDESCAWDQLHIETACPHLLTAMQNDTGLVRVISPGVLGDSCMFSSAELLIAGGATREEMLMSDDSYRSAFESRYVYSGVSAPTITHGSGCMAYMLGLDNRELLPPFLPSYRNEDGVFAALLFKCFPDAYYGHVPTAIFHDPVGDRKYEMSYLERGKRSRVSEIILGTILQCTISSIVKSPSSRLNAAGVCLLEVADLEIDLFDAMIKRVLAIQLSRQLGELAKYIRDMALPNKWRADCTIHRQNIVERLMSSNAWIPIEFGACSVEQAREKLRTYFKQLGMLLIWWPSIIEATSELKRKEKYIYEPII